MVLAQVVPEILRLTIYRVPIMPPILIRVKIIRIHPLASVITTTLLLPVERKVLDFIGNNQYSELICKKN